LALATGNEPCGADALVYAEVVHELEAYARAEPQQTATQSTLRGRSKKIPWYSSDRRYCGLPAGKSCADLKKDLEMAELSRCAYGKFSCEPKFQLVPPMDAKFGLPKERFSLNGFDAQLYKDPREDKYILVFRGTDDLSDWGDNIMQGLGQTTVQYNLAIKLARDINDRLKGSQLELAGHSLAGGLASVAALGIKKNATIFNSAALQPETASSLGLGSEYKDSDKYINHLHTKSDPVNVLQNATTDANFFEIKETPGKTTEITNPDIPWMNEQHRSSPGFFPLVWHSMEAVIHVLDSIIVYNCP